MKHSNTAWRMSALGAVAALALTGCATQGNASDENPTLRLGVVTPLASFAPWEASWANQSPYLQAVYDTLLHADTDGSIMPALATEWSYDDSRTVVTFTLRDDVTFSDGTEFTAEVAAENILRFRDGTSENAAFLTGVQSAVATDTHTLVVTLVEPDPAFLIYMTQNAGLQGSPAMWDDPAAQTEPIGSGPYLLDEEATVAGSTWVFERRDDYWDAESYPYDEIEMTLYGDGTALMNAVKGGQVDATPLQSGTQLAEAEAAGYRAEISEFDWTGFVLADRDGAVNPALGDVRVRQAINHALDRDGLAEALAAGWGTPTTQIFRQTSAAYDPSLDDRYPYDVEKARELLAEAGYPDGFTLAMPKSDFVPEAEYAIYAEQLGAIGITVEWEMTGDDLFGRMLGGSWAAFPMQLQADATAWQGIQFSMLPHSTWNPFKTEDATVVELAQTIRMGEEGAEEQAAAAQELNAYIVEQAWYAPAFRIQSAYVTNDSTRIARQADNAVPYLWNIKPAN
ncbi:ABC transporter substrate-binding protein [Salinibacterium sp. SYSU T00001]|uniref:ABC transporter substrate-binding protein n=1 Tax=Homoserinimonas sedimenticola TaxID=2986805 RepID=UPI002236C0C5|nr:ABC transporter substrate-binding protein [Salinibacterium sedimenticola]MCW4386119.1 ABC transporter substrate-binding protein [Salinibacterium sedimenticola]